MIDISVIDDHTQPFILHPVADPILSLYRFDDNKNNAATFRLVLITDKRLNPVASANLPEGKVTELKNHHDDPLNREKYILSFYKDIRKAFSVLDARFPHTNSTKRSECFCTISTELRHLANSNAKTKLLIIYSDLQENSDGFSVYTSESRKLIRDNPEEVVRLLNRRCLLPHNLYGISVCCVYQPANREEDEAFINMLGIYTLILEKRGAKVFFQADNTSYPL